MIFTISGLDISKHIIVGSYEVNNEDIFNSWEDGNRVEHRDYIRTKAVGKCSLLFSTIEEYQEFVEHMRIHRIHNGGYYNCTIKVINGDAEYSGKFYLSYAPKIEDNATSSEKPGAFELTIEEM